MIGKWTSGPWDRSQVEQKKNWLECSVGAHYSDVCIVRGSINPMVDWIAGAYYFDANVKLIQSSPDLAEALYGMVKLLETNAPQAWRKRQEYINACSALAKAGVE